MKKMLKGLLSFFTILALIFSFINTQKAQASSVKNGVVDVSNELNVRSGPGVKYKKVGILKNKSKVAVYSSKSDWLQINYKGKKAYISDDYVRFYSTLSSSSAKNVTDKVIELQRETWEKNYTKQQIYSIMSSGYTTSYIDKYFKQQFRTAGKDSHHNQLYHIIETEIYGYAIDAFDWNLDYEQSKPTFSHYSKNRTEYLVVSQFHENEESGNHTSTLYLYKSGSKSNWKVYNYITK